MKKVCLFVCLFIHILRSNITYIIYNNLIQFCLMISHCGGILRVKLLLLLNLTILNPSSHQYISPLAHWQGSSSILLQTTRRCCHIYMKKHIKSMYFCTPTVSLFKTDCGKIFDFLKLNNKNWNFSNHLPLFLVYNICISRAFLTCIPINS